MSAQRKFRRAREQLAAKRRDYFEKQRQAEANRTHFRAHKGEAPSGAWARRWALGL